MYGTKVHIFSETPLLFPSKNNDVDNRYMNKSCMTMPIQFFIAKFAQNHFI